MGQSLVKNYVHLVFSTKNRESFITSEIEDELYNYIGTLCKGMNCPPVKIGGYTDHIHILCMLSQKIALMDLLQEVKQKSSKWVKTRDENLSGFYWQNGYGAFSVNPSEIDKVVEYISRQKEHHGKKSFQDEFRAFLKKYNVEYDERYVWD